VEAYISLDFIQELQRLDLKMELDQILSLHRVEVKEQLSYQNLVVLEFINGLEYSIRLVKINVKM
jgi:hypothetical protein